MALKNIKELIDNKGYVIKPQDRKIFEEGDLQSFFGFSRTDAIEFIIYDANDNQLPQLNGELVRYINLSDENIRDYFLIPEGTLLQKFALPNEYFIDVERLLQEAGYSNGIFKTQVTLVNKRAGSEKEFDKLWIQEISPSRTEVRLFPLKQGIETNEELKERFEIFVRGGQFREDVLQIAFGAIEQITPFGIREFVSDKYGEVWIQKVIEEFKIGDLQGLITTIHSSFLQSSLYEFTNRKSKIGENDYGEKKLINPPLSLSKNDIVNTVKRILIETISYYLQKRDINKKTTTVSDFLESEDEVTDILQSENSDTTVPPAVVAIEEIDVVKNTNPVEEISVIGVLEEIEEDATIPEDEEPDIKTPDGEPDFEEIVIDETDTTPIEDDEPIINFDDFFDIVNDEVVLKPIETEDTGIDYNDDRVDIPDEIVVNDEVFEVTPLPIPIAGGSTPSGEGEQGQPVIGNDPLGGTAGGSLGGGSTTTTRRKRKVIREL